MLLIIGHFVGGMSDDLRLQLINNRLQLQQVEAALELDKDNQELKKLQSDLLEVIRLTQELIGEQGTSEDSSWKVGDTCMARCSRDKLFYKANILEVLGNGSCVVNFTDYDMTDICQASLCFLSSLGRFSKRPPYSVVTSDVFILLRVFCLLFIR